MTTGSKTAAAPAARGDRAQRRPGGVRADIQALRAVAALLVVVFHLWPGTLTGGYIGVDVFFVISGFLITSHLLRGGVREGRIGFADFWARRVRRLLPSALLVLAATAVATWVFVPQLYWEQFFKGIAASALYVENWSLAHDAVDYLAEDDAASPTQHYWTLSVEEQFYLVWPLLVALGLVLARRIGRRPLPVVFTVLAVATVASFAYSLHVTATRPAWAFFVTPARAWEFGAGALLAFAAPFAASRLGSRWGAVLAWTGLGVILGCGWTFDAETKMPGTAAAVVVAGSVLVIAGGLAPAHRWSVDRLLDVRPVQFTGDISYPLYLWHWPLIILIPFAQGHPNGQRTLVGILVLTFALAAFSTYLIENPIRFSRRPWLRRPAPTLLTWLTAAAVVAAAGLVTTNRQVAQAADDREVATQFLLDLPRCAGAASIDPEEPCQNPALERILVPSVDAASGDMAKIEGQSCASHAPDQPIVPCHGGDWDDPDTPRVIIVGDSHARMMTTTLQVLADRGVLAWKGYFQSGCILTTAAPVRTTFTRECNSFKERLPEVLGPELDGVDLVITTGRASKLDGSSAQVTAGLTQAWRLFSDRGIPVAALADIPEIGDAVACLDRQPRDRVAACDRDRSDVRAEPDPFLTAAAATPGGVGIDLHPFYCTARVCPVVIGGVIVYANSNHLTATYATTLAPILERELRSRDLLPATPARSRR